MSGDREIPVSEELANIETSPEDSKVVEEPIDTTIEKEQDSADEEIQPQSVDDVLRDLELANNKSEANWDKYIRTQAEMENLRRRSEKDLQNAYKFGLENFVKELIPVIDSLELGIRATTGESEETGKLREGSELTLKQFLSVLEKFNCIQIDPIGEVFNPERHQAMSMQPTLEAEPNTVLTVFQKGYLLNDRLVRPAMVVVAKGMEAPTKIDEQA